MPVIPGVRTIQQRPIYDRVIVAVSTLTVNPVQFFTVPIGSGTGISGVKQIWDTNLNQAQTLPFGKDYLVRAIRFMVQPDITLNDLRRLFSNYILAFIVGDKTYWQGPIQLLPQGGGAFQSGQLSTAVLAITTAAQAWGNGWPDSRSINTLDLPVRIANGENFRVELQGVAFTTDVTASTLFGTGLDMRVILDGEISEFAQ
jgi:hypothetical protein